MGWATTFINQLNEGQVVSFRPHGNSMQPKIRPGQLCVVEPANRHIIKEGDIVLCRVRGQQYLHLVTALRGNQYQISNNKGFVNGWVTLNSIYGKCISVDGKAV